MLKGTRDAILHKLQPISIHGQLSVDVHFSDPEDPDRQVHVARLGPESIPRDLQPGDRIRLQYLVGVVTNVTKAD